MRPVPQCWPGLDGAPVAQFRRVRPRLAAKMADRPPEWHAARARPRAKLRGQALKSKAHILYTHAPRSFGPRPECRTPRARCARLPAFSCPRAAQRMEERNETEPRAGGRRVDELPAGERERASRGCLFPRCGAEPGRAG